MKKLLFIIIAAFIFSFSANSQSNMGIIVGGGVSTPYVRTVSTSLTNLTTGGYSFSMSQPMYNIGLNFENVLVERMLYLQFGLHAMNKGYKVTDILDVNVHGVQIPIDMKYKLFLDKRGENYFSVNLGLYVSASYSGLEYNKVETDAFLDDTSGELTMDNPRIQFGKIYLDPIAEMNTFDYGTLAGFGFGFGNFQINYNFAWGATYYKFDVYGPRIGDTVYGDHMSYYRNTFHSLTAGYYFSNK